MNIPRQGKVCYYLTYCLVSIIYLVNTCLFNAYLDYFFHIEIWIGQPYALSSNDYCEKVHINAKFHLKMFLSKHIVW